MPKAKIKHASRRQQANDAKCAASKNYAEIPDISAPDAALLAAYAAPAGPIAGDAVFAHPFVKGLLATARRQVLGALKAKKGSGHEKWLICVRTYGRARPQADGGLDMFIRRLGRKMDRLPTATDRSRWIKQFVKAGVTSPAELVVALKKPARFQKRLAEIPGDRAIHSKVIERLAKTASEHGAHLKAKGIERGIVDLTLKALELALGHGAHKHCLIFVSHEDPDYTSGRYHEALAGTPWQKRIVVGVRGAHHQVRFIEEAAPQGTHLVVADDNIDSIIVEIANERSSSKFLLPPSEGKSCKTRCLRDHEFESLFDGTVLQAVPEDCMQRFLRAADPRLNAKAKAQELQMHSQTLSFLDITTPEDLVKALSQPKKSLDERLHKLANKFMFSKLQAQLKRGRLPVRRWLVKAKAKAASKAIAAVPRKSASARPAGNVCSASPASLEEGGPELMSLIKRAGQEMKDTGANLWSICPSKNGYFLHSRGAELRKQAKQFGFCQDVSSSLGLIYGAFFGFYALQDPGRYTRFGQIKDDVERSLRYWHKDGIILRFTRYAVVKAQPPGKFHARKGGISAGSSEEAHKERGDQALKAILDDFASPHARFPRNGEKCGDCGLIWEASTAHQLGRSGQPQKRKQPDDTESTPETSQEKHRSPAGAGAKKGKCQKLCTDSAKSCEKQSKHDGKASDAHGKASDVPCQQGSDRNEFGICQKLGKDGGGAIGLGFLELVAAGA